MTIKIENKQQEQITLENLGNEGYRWSTDVYPIDFKPSLTDNFNKGNKNKSLTIPIDTCIEPQEYRHAP